MIDLQSFSFAPLRLCVKNTVFAKRTHASIPSGPRVAFLLFKICPGIHSSFFKPIQGDSRLFNPIQGVLEKKKIVYFLPRRLVPSPSEEDGLASTLSANSGLFGPIGALLPPPMVRINPNQPPQARK
jgi:hypothetical protein